MSMVDNYRPPGPFSHPHRKPVPARSDLRPLTQLEPVQGYATQQTPSTTTTTTTTYSAFPPRTTSTANHPNPLNSSPAYQPYNNAMFTSRRTPSQSTTTSTIAGGGFTTQTTTAFTPSRTPSNVSSSKVSRTSSTRSVTTPPSYVALLRKQKATVWCDRAQPEDPRLSAQHKAAKMRATRELTGMAKGTITAGDARSTGSGSMGSGSLGVRSKIRHHGVPKAQGILGRGVNMAGGGVPTRLSSNEAGDDGVYMGGPPVPGKAPHQRNSSLQSRDSRFLSVDTGSLATVGGGMGNRRLSGGSERTGSGGFEHLSTERIPEMDETPEEERKKDSYFDGGGAQKSAGGSGSERENSFGVVGGLPQTAAVVGSRERASSYGKSGNTAEDLKRRGSVDERGLFPQGTGRLVIANPDAGSDSD